MAIFLFLSAASALIGLLICVLSIYDKEKQKSAYFSLLALAVSFYTIGGFIEFASFTVDAAVIGVQIAYLGLPFIPPLWFLCVREFCGVPIQSKLFTVLIMVIPMAFTLMVLTWPFCTWYISDFTYQSANHISHLVVHPGKLYILKPVYLHSFNILGLITIAYHYIRGTKYFKKQAIILFVSAMIPAFNTFKYTFEQDGQWVDATFVGMVTTMALFYYLMRSRGLQNFSSIIKDSVIDHMHEGVIIFNKSGIYMHSNKTIQEIFPQLVTLPAGTSLSEIKFLPFDVLTLATGENRTKEFTKEHGDCIRTYSLSVSRVDRRHKTIGYTVIVHNITPLKNLMTELEVKANIDPLTGIYNRGFLFEKSQYEVEKAKRGQNYLSVIMFDLDFFKKINDTHGHACGDYVLKTVSRITQQNLRRTDLLGRYGGEEFCVVLPDTKGEAAKNKAEDLRKRLGAHVFEFDEKIIPVSASFGVSSLRHSDPNSDFPSLLKEADENLYKAKANGRNQVFYKE